MHSTTLDEMSIRGAHNSMKNPPNKIKKKKKIQRRLQKILVIRRSRCSLDYAENAFTFSSCFVFFQLYLLIFLWFSMVESIFLHYLQIYKFYFTLIFFIKNKYYNTIYIFINYFIIIFSILKFRKINTIQSDPIN